jgi:plastocyanin
MRSDRGLWRRVGLGLVGLVLVVLVVSAILGVIFGERGEDRSDDTPTIVQGMAVTIDIEDFNFDPGHVSVPAGASVTWVNNDSAPHDATADSDAWQTETLDEDESEAITFDDPGTFTYHCSIHPDMKASLTVREP